MALQGTLIFGTMWMCYAFILYGLLAKSISFLRITGLTQDDLLYWSNWVQLWSLPLILVGSNLLARTTEKMFKQMYVKICEMYEWMKKRDQETHDAVMAELKELRADRDKLNQTLKAIENIAQDRKTCLQQFSKASQRK